MSALSQMSGLILLPLLTRIFSVDEFGTVDVIATFVAFLSTFIKCALPAAIARYFWDYERIEERAVFISSTLVFVSTLGITILFIISVSSKFFWHLLPIQEAYGEYITIGGWTALLSGVISIPTITLRLERKIVAYNLVNLFNTLIFLATALYFVLVVKTGVIGIFYAQVIAYGLASIIALCLIREYIVLKFSLKKLNRALKYSVPLFPARIMLILSAQIDRLLILFFLGLSGVGLFGAAFRISKIARFFIVLFRQAWQPYAMTILNAKDRNQVYRKMLNYYCGVFASIGILLTAMSPELFKLILPNTYHHGYFLTPWLVGAAILHRSGAMTHLGILVSEKTIFMSYISAATILMNISASIILIKAFGITGAAIGSFSAQLLYTSLLLRYSSQKSDVIFNIKKTAIILVIYIGVSIMILIIAKMMENPISFFCRLILGGFSIILILKYSLDNSVKIFVRNLIEKLFMNNHD